MPGGRPTKYRKEYCKQIVDYMSQGNSAVQFAANIGVSKDTIQEWVKEHPEFSVSYRDAMTRCEAHWERIIQAKTVRKMPGNDNLLMFWMKNRFKWSEKIESKNTNEDVITFTTQIGEDGTVHREQS